MRLEREVLRGARRPVYKGRWRQKRRWATSIHGDDRRRSYELVRACVYDVCGKGGREFKAWGGIVAVPDAVRRYVVANWATPVEGLTVSVERLGPVRRSLVHQQRSSCSHPRARSVLNPILFT